jgi:hypothetical protein
MQPASDSGRRLALLVATSVYSDPDLRELRAPGRDAADLSEVLRDPRIGGFGVQMLVNAPSGEVQEGIEDFCADRHPDDQLLIYLSCHGVLDSNGRLYYAAINTKRQRLAATAISSPWLTERLDDCRARRQIVVLDCCHSGAFARGAKGGEELALQQRFEPHGRGRIVLTASRATEYSFEGGQASGEGVPSVFTYAIVSGLRTGDADRDKDGLITVDDLYHYVYDNVRAAEPRQTPAIWTYGAEGDLLVAHSVRGAIIEPEPLPEDLRITLESPRRRVREMGVAELAELLDAARASIALAARQALERIAEEDHPQVAELARIAVGAPSGTAADQVRRELTERAHREEKARREAEEKARREAEEKARREAEEKARREAEEKARREAEEKARREAEEKARREAERIAVAAQRPADPLRTESGGLLAGTADAEASTPADPALEEPVAGSATSTGEVDHHAASKTGDSRLPLATDVMAHGPARHAISRRFVIIAAVAVILIGGLVTGILATNSSNSSNSSNANPPVGTISPVAAPNQENVPGWHTLATFQETPPGGVTVNTSNFTISPPGNWALKYSYDCSNLWDQLDNFIVDEGNGTDSNSNPNKVIINNLDGGRTGMWDAHNDAGQHYLQIFTPCKYTITVLQQ